MSQGVDIDGPQMAIIDRLQAACPGCAASKVKAAAAVIEELVQHACAGAAVDNLEDALAPHSMAFLYDADMRDTRLSVPIASVGPFGWLAEDVAKALLCPGTACTRLDACRDCSLNYKHPPPFAAVRSELIVDGERLYEWLLVSAACDLCAGSGVINVGADGENDAGDCECHDGARADAEAIANRYHEPPTERTLALYVSRCCGQPLTMPRPRSIECSECGTMSQPGNCVPVWAAGNTARVARFRVRAS